MARFSGHSAVWTATGQPKTVSSPRRRPVRLPTTTARKPPGIRVWTATGEHVLVTRGNNSACILLGVGIDIDGMQCWHNGVSSFGQTARPRPRAIWILPVPLLPRAMTFSRRSTYSHTTPQGDTPRYPTPATEVLSALATTDRSQVAPRPSGRLHDEASRGHTRAAWFRSISCASTLGKSQRRHHTWLIPFNSLSSGYLGERRQSMAWSMNSSSVVLEPACRGIPRRRFAV